VPIPYPNIAMPMTGVGFVPKVLCMCGPAHNMSTSIPLSNGDNPGVAMGVASNMVMGETKYVTAAFTVLCHGKPWVRMTSMTTQNKVNIPGIFIAPSQVSVLLLAP
jgi:hypothetical protein